MLLEIRSVRGSDWGAVAAIFNFYVENTLAAFSDEPVEPGYFRDIHAACGDYPFLVACAGSEVVGFAYLAPFHSFGTLRRTATVTYFIHPAYTGKGLGRRFLDSLVDAGRKAGVTNLLAQISSANDGSIRFHQKYGFTWCGCFRDIGVKGGRPFDMIWMQRIEGG